MELEAAGDAQLHRKGGEGRKTASMVEWSKWMSRIGRITCSGRRHRGPRHHPCRILAPAIGTWDHTVYMYIYIYKIERLKRMADEACTNRSLVPCSFVLPHGANTLMSGHTDLALTDTTLAPTGRFSLM